MNKELTLKFDPNTIEHLGISLYSKLPSVISELVSNSWDADANSVEIDFITENNGKRIHYIDDGSGMSFDELNEKYLLIGRNRRRDDGCSKTASGRKVIGKKGLGKLSVFGICDEVRIRTIKNGLENEFFMDINEIKDSKDSLYKPKINKFNISTQESNCTEIWLNKVRRKSPFNVEDIAVGLSKKFVIFDEINLIFKENGCNELKISNELKFKDFKKEFTWDFPNSDLGGEDFKFWNEVTGSIFTLETPVKDTEMKGIYLTSRGKIVNSASFYGLRDTDQFHTYVTGYLSVDFIDDLDEDLISTDRHSLNWEHDVTRELQDYLQKIIKKISLEWKKKRGQKKSDKIKNISGVDVQKWQNDLPSHERELAGKIINPVLENSTIDENDSSQIIDGIIGKFDNQSYKDYAHQITETVSEDQIPKFLKLIDEWKSIETKQIGDLAIARVAVIKKFEELLLDDTKEVPTLHNFLKKFSWLLDPRILEFKDEVTYSHLLRETFSDHDLEEGNRRIDFLCSNALGGILYVIEIKRSRYKVDRKALEQCYEYGAFLTDKFATQNGFNKVVCYVIGGEKSSESLFRAKEKTYMQTGEVYVRTYRELLEQSKNFHQEFVDALILK